jgi:hypothetical protein
MTRPEWVREITQLCSRAFIINEGRVLDENERWIVVTSGKEDSAEVMDIDFPDPGGPHKRMDLDERTMDRIRCSWRSVSTVGMRTLSLVILEASISVKGTRELQGFQEKSVGDTNMSRTGAEGNDTKQILAHAMEND